MDTDVRVERVKALARQAKVYIWSNESIRFLLAMQWSKTFPLV